MVMVFAGGHIYGFRYNPSDAVSVSLAGLSGCRSIWIFLVENFIGGAVAAFAFNYLNGKD